MTRQYIIITPYKTESNQHSFESFESTRVTTSKLWPSGCWIVLINAENLYFFESLLRKGNNWWSINSSSWGILSLFEATRRHENGIQVFFYLHFWDLGKEGGNYCLNPFRLGMMMIISLTLTGSDSTGLARSTLVQPLHPHQSQKKQNDWLCQRLDLYFIWVLYPWPGASEASLGLKTLQVFVFQSSSASGAFYQHRSKRIII